jgi:23S rRNA (adenine2503-C2)-methyltransferase
MISIHDRAAVEEFCRRWRIDPYYLRRFRHALYRRGAPFATAMRYLPADVVPAEVREAFQETFGRSPLELCDRQDSTLDGASKLVFRTAGGGLLETVILRVRSGRTSLCISSQIGCAARCRFCATGGMTGVIDLQAAEMLEQVAFANRLLSDEDRRTRNVVFMGMGEPLHNERQLYEALEILLSDQGFAYPPRRLLVSTVGVPAAMERLADRFPQVPLALSLHSARREIREQLMPIARRHPLAELRGALDRVVALQGRPILIEYLMLRDLNDRREDVTALAEFLSGLPVHVNLIPYNPIDSTAAYQPTERTVRDRFAGWLRDAGLPVTIRYSLGSDIDAACGQLALKS